MFPSRRTFLSYSIHALAVTGLVACGAGPEDSEDLPAPEPEQEMAALIYDLFPHPELDPAVYRRAALTVLAADKSELRAGLLRLSDAAQGQAWTSLSAEQRHRLLAAREDTAFFAALRAAAIEALYRDDSMWAFIGYGGSSIEQGGYLQRGFDNIAWLPATEATR